MAELGFQRSAKKCKEKFENLYKYHKRTKDGRSSKSDGKTYRFFDQLTALENAPPPPSTAAASVAAPSSMATVVVPNSTVSSSNSPNPVSMVLPTLNFSNPLQIQPSHPPAPASLFSNTTSSSSTSSDEDLQRRRGKKRKWKVFFQRLMKDVVQKQEELHKTFLESLEKRERDRTAREEAWRLQERSRLNREHQLLAQERSMAAAKDAAVITFLHKISDQHNIQIPISLRNPDIPRPPPPPPLPPPSNHAAPPPPPVKTSGTEVEKIRRINSPGPSRWPKVEVEALINLRKSMDLTYQETGPKGPLWEEISGAMAKLGFNRSSKRCKEKWENINKYFKKVKESSKRRPEDSKTCPYFHQLDALYRERASSDNSPPIMARPEQQWPQPPPDSSMPDQAHSDHDRDNEDEEEAGEGEAGEDVQVRDGYEMGAITNKQPSSAE
ncbi:trihelix transcription factor DF1-like isoform X2 [Andrographis paniculata]|nr:trihelix transcription factor DF1-like isoform X2 [Andrographis paniculata]